MQNLMKSLLKFIESRCILISRNQHENMWLLKRMQLDK